MLAGRFVLENPGGEVVRTFNVEADELFVIYRFDQNRVEIVASTEGLKKQGVKFDVLRRTSASSLKKRSISLDNGGRFRFVDEVEKTANLVNIPDDSTEEEKKIYKYTAYTQLGIMLVVVIAGLLIEPFLFPKKEEPIVTVIPQNFIQPQQVKTVQAAEKVVPKAKIADKKVVSPVKKAQVLPTRVKSARKENAPLRTKIKVENVGALGVLGGMKTGSKNSAGFNMRANNDSRGTSWSGAGEGGVGGMERAAPGRGLIASAMGRGGKVEGGGGYGTRGKAGGGRPGYGEMNLGGTAASYFEPVQEEALVEGGLDKDQIAAVINRHIGEVIYCYEKGLQVKSNLSGRVNVRFVINGGGIVHTANVVNSSLNSAQVEGCVVSHLRTWRFPKPVGGVNVKVTYPFVLKRVNHG